MFYTQSFNNTFNIFYKRIFNSYNSTKPVCIIIYILYYIMTNYFNKKEKMNKNDLVKTISRDTWINIDTIQKVINSLPNIIVSELSKWKDIKISWLWNFKLTKRKARKWINPKTKQILNLKEVEAPSFQVSKTLKKRYQEINK